MNGVYSDGRREENENRLVVVEKEKVCIPCIVCKKIRKNPALRIITYNNLKNSQQKSRVHISTIPKEADPLDN